jgi:hypothetical protein
VRFVELNLMSANSDDRRFSVSEDGKLILEDEEEANFEDNLTFGSE